MVFNFLAPDLAAILEAAKSDRESSFDKYLIVIIK
jgi:hypothetical protein